MTISDAVFNMRIVEDVNSSNHAKLLYINKKKGTFLAGGKCYLTRMWMWICGFTHSKEFVTEKVHKMASLIERDQSTTRHIHDRVTLNCGRFIARLYTKTSEQLPSHISQRLSSYYLKKYLKNAEKAIREHLDAPTDQIEALPSEDLLASAPSELQCTTTVESRKGTRTTMEDAHFILPLTEGLLTGVFDGHGGSQASKYANLRFQQLFPTALQSARGIVGVAFQNVIDKIHAEIIKTETSGTTAVVCFIDRANRVFTATLGDAEATIYRKINEQIKPIPLSPVRDWHSKKDAQRANGLIYYCSRQITPAEAMTKNPKMLRLKGRTNVSRSIGDRNRLLNGRGIIQKAKITVNKLKAGDSLILACDGLADYAKSPDIIKTISTKSTSEPMASQLCALAEESMTREDGDNVTVIAIEASLN